MMECDSRTAETAGAGAPDYPDAPKHDGPHRAAPLSGGIGFRILNYAKYHRLILYPHQRCPRPSPFPLGSLYWYQISMLGTPDIVPKVENPRGFQGNHGRFGRGVDSFPTALALGDLASVLGRGSVFSVVLQ